MHAADPNLEPPGTGPSGSRFNLNSLSVTQRLIRRVTLGAFILLVLYYLLNILHPFLAALTWASILATAFFSLFERLERRTRRPRLASALTCLLTTLLLVVPVIILLGMLAGESVIAYHTLAVKITVAPRGELEALRNNAIFVWAQSKLSALGLPPLNPADLALRAVRLMSAFLVKKSTGLFAEFTSSIFSFFTVFITLYFLFLHGPLIMDEVRWLCGLTRGYDDQILTRFKETILASLETNLATALLLGTLGGLVFLLFGIPAPLLWGAVMAFLSLIPVVGTALVWLPVVLYYGATAHAGKGAGLLVVFVVLIALVDNLVKPLLMRRQSEIHPFWIFLGVVGGVRYFGLLGFVLGPLVVTAFLAILAILRTGEAEGGIVRE